MTATELKQKLDSGEDIQIMDVRETSEVAIGRIPNSIHISLAQVLDRSARAIEALERSGLRGKFVELTGGIIAWSNEVDASVPKY